MTRWLLPASVNKEQESGRDCKWRRKLSQVTEPALSLVFRGCDAWQLVSSCMFWSVYERGRVFFFPRANAKFPIFGGDPPQR